MAVNNFRQIENLLEFRTKDDFYFVQVLQRKKDAVQGDLNPPGSNSRLIKMYQIHSKEKLQLVESEIISLCEMFNARAGIDLNRKSFRDSSLQTARLIMDQYINHSYPDAIKAYSSVCGRYSNESEKKWIIDLDKEDLGHLSGILKSIDNCRPEGHKILAQIPSKSGIHLITSPFDVQQFKSTYPNIEIQKQNPTNLYIPTKDENSL